jgi:nicotinate-nucleotide pyrophosphorylase
MHTTDDLIQLALKEDIGPGDITTDNLVAPGDPWNGRHCRQAGSGDRRPPGSPKSLYHAGADRSIFEALFADGDRVPAGSTVVRIEVHWPPC